MKKGFHGILCFYCDFTLVENCCELDEGKSKIFRNLKLRKNRNAIIHIQLECHMEKRSRNWDNGATLKDIH